MGEKLVWTIFRKFRVGWALLQVFTSFQRYPVVPPFISIGLLVTHHHLSIRPKYSNFYHAKVIVLGKRTVLKISESFD